MSRQSKSFFSVGLCNPWHWSGKFIHIVQMDLRFGRCCWHGLNRIMQKKQQTRSNKLNKGKFQLDNGRLLKCVECVKFWRRNWLQYWCKAICRILIYVQFHLPFSDTIDLLPKHKLFSVCDENSKKYSRVAVFISTFSSD